MLLLCKTPKHFGHALHLDVPSSITLWIWQVRWEFYSPDWSRTLASRLNVNKNATMIGFCVSGFALHNKNPYGHPTTGAGKGLALSEIQSTRNYPTARWRQLDVASTSGHEYNVDATSTSATCFMESRRRWRRRHPLKCSHRVVCNYCHRMQQLP